MDEFFSVLAKWLPTCCSPTPPPPPPPPLIAVDDGQLNVKPIVDGQVYLLREPAEGMEVRVDIVFFHGLQLLSYEKAYMETWQVSIGKEGEQKKIICWPKVWLGSDFPDARVLSVSYDSRAVGRSTETTRDIAKALLKSLVELAGVGHNRPVILVGHSLGGLIIKLLCKEAGQLQNADDGDGGGKYVEFMENLLGVFFYATPHGGTALAREVCRKLGSVVHLAPALKFLAKENYNLLELTEDFNTQRRHWKWKTCALVEVQRIRLGPLAGVLVVPSESVRFDIADKYTSVKDADHFSICKPPSKTHESYQWIQEFVNRLLQEDDSPAQIDRPYRAVRAILKGHNGAKQAIEYIDRSTKQGANNVRRLLDAGVMSPLLRVLESPNPSSVDIRIAACWALDALAYDGKGGTSKEAMQAAEEGGASIPSLLQMLTDDKTVFAAIYCLRVLTGNNAGNRKLLMERMEAKGILQSLYISPPPSIESPKSVSRAAKDILDVMNWASELESYEKLPTKQPVSIFVNYTAPKSSSS